MHSGFLEGDDNYITVIISGVLNSFGRVKQEYKKMITDLLNPYYVEYENYYSLLRGASLKGSDFYKKINKSYLERIMKAFRVNKIEDHDLSFNTDDYMTYEKIKKHFALHYFYIFNDIVNKIIICMEIITKKRRSIEPEKWASYWNISSLDLDKKYNFRFFNNYYYPMDKEMLRIKLNKMFLAVISNHHSEGTTTDVNQNLKYFDLINDVTPEQINTIKNNYIYNKFTNMSDIKHMSQDLTVYTKETAAMIIKNLYFNKDNNLYTLKEYSVADFDNLNRVDRNSAWYIDPSACIAGMYLTPMAHIFMNRDLIIKDTTDANYKVFKEYINNSNSFNNKKYVPSANLANKPVIFNPRKLLLNPVKKHFRIFDQPPINISSNKTIKIDKNAFYSIKKLKIKKDLVNKYINQIYNNDNIEKICSSLNKVSINVFDSRKNIKQIFLGDLIFNIDSAPLFKKRKTELNNFYNSSKDLYKSIKSNNNDIYKTNIFNDLNNVAEFVGLNISSSVNDSHSLKQQFKLENPIVISNNYNKKIMTIFNNFYDSLSTYISFINNKRQPVPVVFNVISSSIVNEYNKLNYNFVVKDKYIKRYNDVFLLTYSELKKLYKYYRKVYNNTDDSLDMFIINLYKNALLLELYEFTIGITGTNSRDNNFINITTVYMKHKIIIDKLYNLYEALTRHYYITLNSFDPLNTENMHYVNVENVKKYKKYNNVASIIVDDVYEEEIIYQNDHNEGLNEDDDDYRDLLELDKEDDPELYNLEEEENNDGDGNLDIDDIVEEEFVESFNEEDKILFDQDGNKYDIIAIN
jgi:hypothetical protein